MLLDIIKGYIRHTRLGIIIVRHRQIPLRLRFLNWFVQRVIYRTPNLKFSLHFATLLSQR